MSAPDGGGEMHGVGSITEEDGSVVVTVPASAIERSALSVDEDTMVVSQEDGPVVLAPWVGESLREALNRDG